MNEQLFAGRVSRLKKRINTAFCFYLNILPWLSLLHFHQVVSFVEDRNAAIIMFSFFKGSRLVDSPPTTESLVYLGLRWIPSYFLLLIISSGRGTSAPDQKVFSILFSSQIPKIVENIFENSTGIFKVFTLPLKIPDKAWPLETPQNCVAHFRNFKTLKARSLEISHDFFFYLITPENAMFFLIS